MANALIDSVLHWRRKLDKDPQDDYILNAIRKLSKVPMTVEILEATHIGKTIRKLSKRDDIVGEKAKTILNKWRVAFSSQVSDKNEKLPNDSKKENFDKERKPSNKYISHEKTIDSRKQTSHNHEYKYRNSKLPSLCEQSSKMYINGSHNTNNSIQSSPSLYKYDVKERNSKYMDYDPHTESSEGYNPECPELFPSDKPVKTKKPVLVETYEPSTVKRKLTNGNEDNPKKFKSSSYSNSNNADEWQQSSEKKDKEKTKESSHSSTPKKDSCDLKSHSKTHEKQSDAQKTKRKQFSENGRMKSKKAKTKMKESLLSFTNVEFTSSEVSFEDCLGFNDIVTLKKSSKSHSSKKPTSNVSSKEKPTSNVSSTEKPTSNVSSKEKLVEKRKKAVSSDQKVKISKSDKKSKISKDSYDCNKEVPFTVPKPALKLEAADITSTLPEIQPHYRPLPRSPEFYSPKKKENLLNEEVIKFTSSRREKTAVYSGRKNAIFYTEVPTLFNACIRVLIENIDAIECVGDATFEMMYKILDRCSPSQLLNIENFNPKFINDTNDLWEAHCKRDYKLLTPMEHESWRDLYWRAHDEMDRKLKSVTAHISKSISTSVPVRQVKLAYVDSCGYVKPPRDVARKQAKHGTAATSKPGLTSKQTVKPSVSVASSTPTSSSSLSNSARQKPKIAPLMAKTLKSMKAFRRK